MNDSNIYGIMSYKYITPPTEGEAIQIKNSKLQIPNNPIIPFIEGDGIGPDIWRATQKVLDAAVKKSYGDERRIEWFEVFAGEKAYKKFADKYKEQPENAWLPPDTLQAFREYRVGIKGPLTTPVGGGIRSLNVALRQKLDLYVCQRPVRWFNEVPSPVKEPHKVSMVIFRENTEDIYAGIEFEEGTPEAKKFFDFLKDSFPEHAKKVRFPDTAAYGIKPVSNEGTTRIVRDAISYAIEHGLDSVTLVHKGNIMKFTEGAFRDWGYELARREFGATLIGDGPWCKLKTKEGREIVIKDVIADAFLQQIILRPEEYDVIATLNLWRLH